MQSARIDTNRLMKVVVIWLIVPMIVCIVLDVSLDLLPLLTLGASVIVLPVASVIVTRAVLFEFDKVIQEVQSEETDADKIASSENDTFGSVDI